MASNIDQTESSEVKFSFEEELFFCQLHLEKKLQSKISPKEAEIVMQSMKILRSHKAPFIKKRQAMRLSCGDYRKAMQEIVKCQETQLRSSTFGEKQWPKSRMLSQKAAASSTGRGKELHVSHNFQFNFPAPMDKDHPTS